MNMMSERPSQSETIPRASKCFRFCLLHGTIILGFVAIAVVFGVWQSVVAPGHAISALKRQGAILADLRDPWSLDSDQQPTDSWSDGLYVDLRVWSGTETDFTAVRNLTGTTAVNLQGRNWVTDRHLMILGYLTSLTWLDLSETGISDEGIKYLSKLGRLRTLNLCGTRVTDAGLGGLRSLRCLEHLDVSGTAVTDDGLSELSGIVSIRALLAHNTGITNAGLTSLSRYPQLRTFGCLGTRITTDGLSRLKLLIPRGRILYPSLMDE